MCRDLKQKGICVVLCDKWGARCQSGQRSERGWYNPQHEFIPDSLKGCHSWSDPGLVAWPSWPTHGLPVSLLGVTELLWIDTGVCSVLSAGHWHVWIMSARPQLQCSWLASLHGQHIWVSMETGTSTATTALASVCCVFQKTLIFLLSLCVICFLYFFFFFFLCVLFTWLVTLSRELEACNSLQRALYSQANKSLGHRRSRWLNERCTSSFWVPCRYVLLPGESIAEAGAS